jgi:type I restriction enzyme S subunit
MRDSGVEWIGEVPDGWEMYRLKFIADCFDGKRVPIDASQRRVGPYPYWGSGSIQDYVDDYIFDEELVLLGEDGAPFFDKCRDVAFLVRGKIWVNNHIHVLKAKSRCTNQYLCYALNVVDYSDYVSGSILLKLTQGRMNEIVVPIPPFPEQRRIADYLDEKCAAIDGAVDELKRGIEDCKAWKKAIIFEAVTGKKRVMGNGERGMGRMRDSGIPWIGEIPEGWEVKPLRRLGRLANGISKGGEYFGKGFPFVSYSDVYKNDAIPTQVKGLVEANDQERERYSVKRGDVFFTRTSETVDEIGIAAACLKDIQDSTFAGFLIRFRPMTDELLPEFSKYYFRNKLVSEYFAKELVMVTRASLGQELLRSLPVFIPPMKEQQAIADYLDEKCAAIDALVAEKEKLIADLEAYKKSLIFELVTGKREVA